MRECIRCKEREEYAARNGSHRERFENRQNFDG